MSAFLRYGAPGAVGILAALAAWIWLGYLSPSAILLVALATTALVMITISIARAIMGKKGGAAQADQPDDKDA